MTRPGEEPSSDDRDRRGEIRVSLDLDRAELAGRVVVGEGEARPFVSWLGLIAALGAAAETLRQEKFVVGPRCEPPAGGG